MVKQPPKQPPKRRKDLYFATKLSRAMDARGAEVTKLAGQVGVIQTRVTKWLRGTGAPEPRTLLRLSRALGVPLAYWCDPDIEDPADAVGWAGDADPGSGATPIQLPEVEVAIRAAIKRLGPEESLRRLMDAPSATPRDGADYARVVRTRVHRTARQESDAAPPSEAPRDRRRKPRP